MMAVQGAVTLAEMRGEARLVTGLGVGVLQETVHSGEVLQAVVSLAAALLAALEGAELWAWVLEAEQEEQKAE